MWNELSALLWRTLPLLTEPADLGGVMVEHRRPILARPGADLNCLSRIVQPLHQPQEDLRPQHLFELTDILGSVKPRGMQVVKHRVGRLPNRHRQDRYVQRHRIADFLVQPSACTG